MIGAHPCSVKNQVLGNPALFVFRATLQTRRTAIADMKKLVLASTSPYRAALLRRLGLPFVQFNPSIDETPGSGETGEHLVKRLSHAKAMAAQRSYPEAIIIGSDQAGVLGNALLNKPSTRAAARAQLRASSGRDAMFLTGLCVLDAATGENLLSVDVCRVLFRELDDAEIEDYIERENPLDCAGSFKVEGLGIALFRSVVMEDPTTLEGLPLIRLTSALRHFGLPVLGVRAAPN